MNDVRMMVVEDAADLRSELVDYFRLYGFDVHGVNSIANMAAALEQSRWDVLLLDLSLPDGDALQHLKALRARYGLSLGIIVMTARGQVEDRVAGRALGADTYLVKPVDLRELSAAVDQLVTRLRPLDGADRNSAWQLNVSARRLRCPDGSVIELTGAEARLLAILLAARGETIGREALCRTTYGTTEVPDTRRLDTLVSRLRTKVDQQTGIPLPISTFRNIGYAFFNDAAE